MESENEESREVKEPAEQPFRSKLGQITMFTDNIPTRKEILEAKKQQLRDRGML